MCPLIIRRLKLSFIPDAGYIPGCVGFIKIRGIQGNE